MEIIKNLKEIAIAAGIVLYNPDLKRLKESLDSIVPQVQMLIVVDNHSGNKMGIMELLNKYNILLEYIPNLQNEGIAKALNQIMQRAEEKGYTWVLTLDDDSVCDKNLIKEYKKVIRKEKLGIICPEIRDDKKINKKRSNKKYEWVYETITAGSLTNVNIWKKIGGFDEQMFIDFVDVEYCKRLIINDYKILRVNTVYVNQQFGNNQGMICILGYPIYLFNYSSTRIYYSIRNQIYYMKKHKKHVNILKQILFLIGFSMKRIIFEENKYQNFRAIIKGIKDGLCLVPLRIYTIQ